MKKHTQLLTASSFLMMTMSCGDPGSHGHSHDHSHEEHGHGHAEEESKEDKHEISLLGEFDVAGMPVKAAQGHGSVEAGKESHLAIKLPFEDKGETNVRVWIGVEDRTLSAVGKARYSSSHADYHAHAIAPDPLPEGASWWIEIEKPDGTKHVGPIPFLKDVGKG